jgi:hypothetical protein
VIPQVRAAKESATPKDALSEMLRIMTTCADLAVGMGADIAVDLRKSFAMATGGPPSMQGREVKPGSVITTDYAEAEEREARGRRDAKKRQSSSNPPKQSNRQSAGASRQNQWGSKGGRRYSDKPRRRNYWENEVHLTSVFVSRIYDRILAERS